MKVIFYNVPDARIKNFEKLSFSEAVAISDKVERDCRNENVQFTSEFQVLDDSDKIYYKGTFDFGSYDYPNIYHKIKKMVNRIKVDKQHQADKLYLLDQLEKLTPPEYKNEEKIDKLLINLERSRVSKLKSWQRKTMYGLGAVGLTGFLMTGFLFVAQKDSYEKALADGRNQVEQVQKLSEMYEVAILGEREEMITSLEKLEKEDRTEKQLQILFGQYITNNEFEKAAALFDNDYVQAETMIMNSSLDREVKKEKITKFNEVYPTNEAKYDLAYIDRNYELMLNIPNVMMTVKRSEMKTYGLIKVGKIDEAKIELNNNNSEDLSEKITKYEVIMAEIQTLEEKNQLLVKEEKANEAKVVQDEIAAKKQELQAL